MNDDTHRRIPSASAIEAWTHEERASVARRLAAIESIYAPVSTRWRRFAITIAIVSAVVMVPWILYLSQHLRTHHRVEMWNITWIGFNILLTLSFAASAWAMWKRRLIAVVTLTTTAICLLVDAWFDTTLSWGTREQTVSLLTAAFVELPLFVAIALWIRSSLQRWSANLARLRGETDPPRGVLAQPMPVLPIFDDDADDADAID